VEGADAFRALIADAQTVLTFYLQQLALQHDLGTMQGKAQALEAFKPLLLKARDPVRRDLLLREVAHHLGIDEQAVRQELHQESRRSRPRERMPEAESAPMQDPPRREKEFLGLLLNYPQFIPPTAQQLAPDVFIDPRSQTLARTLFARTDDSRLDISLLMTSVEDPAVAQLISTCAVQGFAESQVEQQWCDSIRRFQLDGLTRRIEAAQQTLQTAAQAGAAEEVDRINAELVALIRERQQLAAEQNP
jgi:DNA primase